MCNCEVAAWVVRSDGGVGLGTERLCQRARRIAIDALVPPLEDRVLYQKGRIGAIIKILLDIVFDKRRKPRVMTRGLIFCWRAQHQIAVGGGLEGAEAHAVVEAVGGVFAVAVKGERDGVGVGVS